MVTGPHTQTHTHTNPQTGPITIQCAAALLACSVTMCAVQGSFVRQNTPFPKDLRTRLVKTPPKSVDGHITAHNPNKLASSAFIGMSWSIVITSSLCGSVAEWFGRWTCDQQASSLNPGHPAVECNPANTLVPLSPSSII